MVKVAAREFHWHASMKGEILTFSLRQGFLLFHFQEKEDRDVVLQQPWVVSDQALMVEPWRPRFHPSSDAITFALVWVRMSQIPMKLWGPATMQNIVSLAGELVAVDECTDRLEES